MVVWCVVLFILGVFGILQDIVIADLGNSGRVVILVLMLIVVGILIRIRTKEKAGEKEMLRARIEELERRLKERAL